VSMVFGTQERAARRAAGLVLTVAGLALSL
jgi:hypothetical protein